MCDDLCIDTNPSCQFSSAELGVRSAYSQTTHGIVTPSGARLADGIKLILHLVRSPHFELECHYMLREILLNTASTQIRPIVYFFHLPGLCTISAPSSRVFDQSDALT